LSLKKEGFTKPEVKKNFTSTPLNGAKICKTLKNLTSGMPIDQGLDEVEVNSKKAGH